MSGDPTDWDLAKSAANFFSNSDCYCIFALLRLRGAKSGNVGIVVLPEREEVSEKLVSSRSSRRSTSCISFPNRTDMDRSALPSRSCVQSQARIY